MTDEERRIALLTAIWEEALYVHPRLDIEGAAFMIIPLNGNRTRIIRIMSHEVMTYGDYY